MSAMASQITSLTIIYSTVYSGVASSKKTSKLRVTGLCEGNLPVTGDFPAQRVSNAENVSIWWRHHAISDVIWMQISVNAWKCRYEQYQMHVTLWNITQSLLNAKQISKYECNTYRGPNKQYDMKANIMEYPMNINVNTIECQITADIWMQTSMKIYAWMQKLSNAL